MIEQYSLPTVPLFAIKGEGTSQMKLGPDKHKILSKILTLGPDNEMLKTALTLQAPKYNLVLEENVKVIQFQDGRTVLGGLARDVQYIPLIMTSQYHIFILNIDMGGYL